MPDSMTPLERAQALKENKPVDRLPITLSHEGFSARKAGLSYREAFNTPEKVAEKEINMYKTYGLDHVSVNYTSVSFGIRHRSKIKSPKDMAASISEHVLRDINDIDQLNPEYTDFKRDVAQKVNYKAAQIIQEEIGEEIACTYSISAPFTIATGVIAPEKLLRATRKAPDKVHELMRFTTDSLKKLVDEVADLTFLNFFIYDPVASGSLISPKQYNEFCLPYTKELVEYIKKDDQDRWVGMHICGNTTANLDNIVSTGIDAFSLDQEVDLSVAKEKIGDRVTLMGNVDPIRLFLQGTPEEMDAAVKESFDKAGDSPKGFVIRSGCGVPYESPLENIAAYVASCKKYGAV